MQGFETRYAKSGEVHSAYQVVGQGPIDIVFVQGFISNLEVQWEDPGLSHLLNRLADFSRLILFGATYPERTCALLLYGAYAHFFSWVQSREQVAAFVASADANWAMAPVWPILRLACSPMFGFGYDARPDDRCEAVVRRSRRLRAGWAGRPYPAVRGP